MTVLIFVYCGFIFLVEKWKLYVPGVTAVSKRNQDLWKSVVRKMKQWIYSWMRPGYVENAEEHKISKLLLLQFVCSAAVLNAVDGHVYIVTAMLRFLQGYVFIHESLFLHYLRKHVRHYDVSHGSQHEASDPLFHV